MILTTESTDFTEKKYEKTSIKFSVVLSYSPSCPPVGGSAFRRDNSWINNKLQQPAWLDTRSCQARAGGEPVF